MRSSRSPNYNWASRAARLFYQWSCTSRCSLLALSNTLKAAVHLLIRGSLRAFFRLLLVPISSLLREKSSSRSETRKKANWTERIRGRRTKSEQASERSAVLELFTSNRSENRKNVDINLVSINSTCDDKTVLIASDVNERASEWRHCECKRVVYSDGSAFERVIYRQSRCRSKHFWPWTHNRGILNEKSCRNMIDMPMRNREGLFQLKCARYWQSIQFNFVQIWLPAWRSDTEKLFLVHHHTWRQNICQVRALPRLSDTEKYANKRLALSRHSARGRGRRPT